MGVFALIFRDVDLILSLITRIRVESLYFKKLEILIVLYLCLKIFFLTLTQVISHFRGFELLNQFLLSLSGFKK